VAERPPSTAFLCLAKAVDGRSPPIVTITAVSPAGDDHSSVTGRSVGLAAG